MNKTSLIANTIMNVYDNENIRTKNLKNNRSQNGHHSIQDIFIRYWPAFKIKYADKLTRESVVNSVESFIKCMSFDNGFIFYECTNCNNFHITGLPCKSRFCPSCSNKYRDSRVLAMSEKCIDTEYRHIVFTIPEELRKYFRRNWNLLHVLFKSVNDVFTYITSKGRKNTKQSLGFMSTLHTFGRDLKWNPHIHCLISESKIINNCKLINYNYFHYELLRKTYMRILLNNLYGVIKTKEFYHLKNRLYSQYKKGFYVYAPKIQLTSFKKEKIMNLVKYVTRYASHPPMSESRITNVDHENMTITYYYDPHEDDNVKSSKKIGRQYITEPIFKFMRKLLIHIPNKSFHMIRYYGFFSNKSKINLNKCSSRLYKKDILNRTKQLLKWRYRIFLSFKYDPLLCSCGHVMKLDYGSCYFP